LKVLLSKISHTRSKDVKYYCYVSLSPRILAGRRIACHFMVEHSLRWRRPLSPLPALRLCF